MPGRRPDGVDRNRRLQPHLVVGREGHGVGCDALRREQGGERGEGAVAHRSQRARRCRGRRGLVRAARVGGGCGLPRRGWRCFMSAHRARLRTGGLVRLRKDASMRARRVRRTAIPRQQRRQHGALTERPDRDAHAHVAPDEGHVRPVYPRSLTGKPGIAGGAGSPLQQSLHELEHRLRPIRSVGPCQGSALRVSQASRSSSRRPSGASSARRRISARSFSFASSMQSNGSSGATWSSASRSAAATKPAWAPGRPPAA